MGWRPGVHRWLQPIPGPTYYTWHGRASQLKQSPTCRWAPSHTQWYKEPPWQRVWHCTNAKGKLNAPHNQASQRWSHNPIPSRVGARLRVGPLTHFPTPLHPLSHPTRGWLALHPIQAGWAPTMHGNHGLGGCQAGCPPGSPSHHRQGPGRAPWGPTTRQFPPRRAEGKGIQSAWPEGAISLSPWSGWSLAFQTPTMACSARQWDERGSSVALIPALGDAPFPWRGCPLPHASHACRFDGRGFPHATHLPN